MAKLDRTGQRIVGVLIEKQLSVPDTYPMSENALVDGCNQKSNRDPITELPSFAIAGALLWLQEHGFVSQVVGGGRVAKYRHRMVDNLQLTNHELAILAELLLRGPQAPGALKPRVQRMGYHASPEAIAALLAGLAARKPALVEQLPLGPRERERRWRHLLGDGSEATAGPADVSAPAATAVEFSSPGERLPPTKSADDDTLAALQQQVRELAERLAAVEQELADRRARP